MKKKARSAEEFATCAHRPCIVSRCGGVSADIENVCGHCGRRIYRFDGETEWHTGMDMDIAEAVAAERQACAKIISNWNGRVPDRLEMVAAILARGVEPPRVDDADEAVAAERERCCADICGLCRVGDKPVEGQDGILWHRRPYAKGTGEAHYICEAAKIRARGKEQG